MKVEGLKPCPFWSDIRMDMEICRLEGWDETEFIWQLHGELDRFVKKMEQKVG